MVKGVSRRVIVVESPDPRIFEQAIFILPTDGGGVSSRQLVDQAVRIARSYARGQGGARTRWRPPAWLWAVWGAAACGLVWLLAALLYMAYPQRFPAVSALMGSVFSPHLGRTHRVRLLFCPRRSASGTFFCPFFGTLPVGE